MFLTNRVGSQNSLPIVMSVFTTVFFVFLYSSTNASSKNKSTPPAVPFDLSHWKLSVPVDDDKDKRSDVISVKDLKKYYHPDFFYLDSNQYMVFTAPNKGPTTKNSKNARSELRQMLAGKNKYIKANAPKNNFSLAAHRYAKIFGSIGGKMSASLKVNHVAKRVMDAKKSSAYSVVVGQIHAGKVEGAEDGFGYGNEPLKIFYKKFPGHKTGSVFWTYERNLKKGNPDRKDIVYSVWGNGRKNGDDPGDSGIALGETFNYEVNVHGNTMYLSFQSEGHSKVEYGVNLTTNVDANGKVDQLDNPKGYAGDWFYFKAGAYNQCNVEKVKCHGTGEWAKDKKNGDYTSVVFSRLRVGDSTPPKIR